MSHPSNPILSLKTVRFSYSDAPFIDNLSMDVSEGDFIGLLGRNGSGKSTVLKILGGYLSPSSGEAYLWNKRISQYRGQDRAKLISYLPQALDAGLPFTVGEVASMGLYPYHIRPGLTVPDSLKMVGLDDKADTPLWKLSGGEQRRAYIATTLIQGAGILLMDEPLANLDIKYQMELLALLRRLNDEKNITIIMALHDINLALGFKGLAILKDGKVVSSGPSEEVLNERTILDAFDVHASLIRHGTQTYIAAHPPLAG